MMSNFLQNWNGSRAVASSGRCSHGWSRRARRARPRVSRALQAGAIPTVPTYFLVQSILLHLACDWLSLRMPRSYSVCVWAAVLHLNYEHTLWNTKLEIEIRTLFTSYQIESMELPVSNKIKCPADATRLPPRFPWITPTVHVVLILIVLCNMQFGAQKHTIFTWSQFAPARIGFETFRIKKTMHRNS